MKLTLERYNSNEIYTIYTKMDGHTLEDMLLLYKRLLLSAGYQIETSEVIICKDSKSIVSDAKRVDR